MGALKPAIRIAIVHDFLQNFRGGERTLQALHELFPEAPIYTLLADPKIVAEHFPKATVIPSYLQKSIWRNYRQLLLSRFPQAIESFDFSDFDMVISSSAAFSHGIITGPETYHICYCHSPMRYAWDWHHEYLVEKNLDTGLKGILVRSVIKKLRFWDAIAAKRVDYWIANSETVKERITKYYRADSRVIYPPVDVTYIQESAPRIKEEDYALTVSWLSPYKRVDLLIKACHQLKLPLVVIGKGEQEDALRALAKQLGADVTMVTDADDGTKRSYLQHARCFLFAAEDDFGIAPIEALAAGIPVIAFAKGGTGETIRPGKDGELFATLNVQEVAEKIKQVLDNSDEYPANSLRARAEHFSRERFQAQITALIHHVSRI